MRIDWSKSVLFVEYETKRHDKAEWVKMPHKLPFNAVTFGEVRRKFAQCVKETIGDQYTARITKISRS